MIRRHHQEKVTLNRIGRRASVFALAIWILLLPLPRHWVLLEQDFAGMYHELTSLSLYLSDFANLLLLIGGATWLKWRQRSDLEVKSLTYPLALLWLWSALSNLWALDLLLSLQMTLRLLILLVTSWIIIRLRPGRRWVQYSLAVTMMVQAGAAVAQYWLQHDLGLRWLGETELTPVPGGNSILLAGQKYWLRSYGLTPHPNILGGILALFILALLAAYLQAPNRARPAWLLLLLVGAAALFLSFSRAAWLGAVLGGIFFLLGIVLHSPWRQVYLQPLAFLMLAGGLLLAGLAWQQRPLLLARLSPRSSQPESRSLDERAVLSWAGRQVIRINPLLGIGAHNSTVAIFPFVVASSNFTPQPIHNMLLLITAELGIVGGGIWLWLMLLPPCFSLRRLRQGQLTLWALALAAALLAFATIDLFDFYAWGWTQGLQLRWLFWGLWGAAVSRPAAAA